MFSIRIVLRGPFFKEIGNQFNVHAYLRIATKPSNMSSLWYKHQHKSNTSSYKWPYLANELRRYSIKIINIHY